MTKHSVAQARNSLGAVLIDTTGPKLAVLVVHSGCSRRMMARNADGGILFAVELRGRDPCRRLHRRLALAKERDERWHGRHNVVALARTEQRKLEAAPMDMSTKIFHHLFAPSFRHK